MRTVFIDTVTFHCYVTQNNEGTLIPHETEFFSGKCDMFIEGYRIIPSGYTWISSDGIVFRGEMITPWKDYSELDSAQREYEQQLLEEYKTMQQELNNSYTEGVNNI